MRNPAPKMTAGMPSGIDTRKSSVPRRKRYRAPPRMSTHAMTNPSGSVIATAVRAYVTLLRIAEVASGREKSVTKLFVERWSKENLPVQYGDSETKISAQIGSTVDTAA